MSQLITQVSSSSSYEMSIQEPQLKRPNPWTADLDSNESPKKMSIEFNKSFGEESLSDISFVVANEDDSDDDIKIFETTKARTKHCFRVDRATLAARSPVFKKMFDDVTTDDGEIIITDVDPMAFNIVLGYVYSGEISLADLDLVEILPEILYAAEKYQLFGLKNLTEEKMMKNLSPSTFYTYSQNQVYERLNCFRMTSFCEHFVDFLRKNALLLIEDEKFDQVCRYDLKLLLEQESANVTEANLFEAVIRWARKKCLNNNSNQLRSKLGDLLYLIRFTTMTSAEFVEGPMRENIFNSNEIWQLMQQINCSNVRPESEFLDKFIKQPRQTYHTCGLQLNESKVKQNGQETTTQVPFAILLRSSHDIILSGFDVNSPTEFQAFSLIITDESGSINLCKERPLFTSVADRPNCYHHKLAAPILIKRMNLFKIDVRCLFACISFHTYERDALQVDYHRPYSLETITLSYKHSRHSFIIDKLFVY